MQHRGAPLIWDQPIQTHEHPSELVRAVEEPVASTSALPLSESGYWLNVMEQHAPLMNL